MFKYLTSPDFPEPNNQNLKSFCEVAELYAALDSCHVEAISAGEDIFLL